MHVCEHSLELKTNTTEETVPIASVDLAKSHIIASKRSAGPGFTSMSSRIIDSTTIGFDANTTTSTTIEYQVVETY